MNMVISTYIDELEQFFKALADANRLKIVGLLAQGPLSVEQIAEMLKISSSTVSHHLSRLSRAGLVSAKAEGYYSVYRLEEKTLEDMSKRLMAKENLPAAAADVDANAFDKKVLTSYLEIDGSIKEIPIGRKKLEVILRYMMKEFEPNRTYTEKEVNEIIKRFNPDISGLRRDLIDFRFLGRERDGSAYWVITETIK
jgi:DNA-binding HxlR family transcriptional regulator